MHASSVATWRMSRREAGESVGRIGDCSSICSSASMAPLTWPISPGDSARFHSLNQRGNRRLTESGDVVNRREIRHDGDEPVDARRILLTL